MKIAAIVVAAGRGERAGPHPDGPKQYRRLGARTVLGHTLGGLLSQDGLDSLVLVHHPDDLERARAACEGLPVALVEGGATRQASVLAGLEWLAGSGSEPDTVLVHDAVRPFAEPALIERTLGALHEADGAVPAIPAADTLKRGQNGRILQTVDRNGIFAAQTPQAFRFASILEAHRKAARSPGIDFTDDASIAEWHGLTVALVTGSRSNVKLTTADDLREAERMLAPPATIDVRTGNGYDVHRLVPGDGVTLCGVMIPHDGRLDGHSDADVCLHALTDALLATCGAGDIGDHFPPSDPQWRGASSSIFVEHAVSLVSRKGGRILNADITLICEAPKISPYREAMRARIGELTGLSLDRVSVKATTNERIGFVGREEGIASIVTASVNYGA